MKEITEVKNEIKSCPDFSDNEESKQTYRIYDYFKEHTSFFVTVVSAFVAGVSVLLKLIAFFNANAYLKYFEADNNIYKQSVGFVYFMAITLAFLAIFIIFQIFISKTFQAYLPHKKVYLFFKYSLRSLKNEQKLIIKERRKVKRRISKFSKTNKSDSIIQELENDIHALEEQAKRIKNHYKSASKNIKKNRFICFLMVLISCLFAGIIFCILYTLWISIAISEWEKIVQSSVIFSIAYVLINAIENWLLTCSIPLKRKEIKKDAKLKIENTILKYNNYEQFPLGSIVDGKIKDIFTDSNCKTIIATIVACLMGLSIASIFTGSYGAAKQNEFFIVGIDNQNYAIIYDNGEDAIIEKVEIIGTDITINTNHQKIISSKNIDKTKYTFDNIKIVRDANYFNDANN